MTLFDGLHDPALLCAECGWRDGHSPDCNTIFVPVCLGFNASLTEGFAVPEEFGVEPMPCEIACLYRHRQKVYTIYRSRARIVNIEL